MKIFFGITLTVIFFGLSSFLYSKKNSGVPTSKITFVNSPRDVVIVGYKTSDSTAQVSISNSDLQQNIVSTIPELNGATITNDPLSIKVNQVTGYLLFSVTDTANQKLSVGLELIFNSSNLVYSLKSGRQIHICKSISNCNGCSFIFSEAWIVGCKCSMANTLDSTLVPNCQDLQTVSH